MLYSCTQYGNSGYQMVKAPSYTLYSVRGAEA